MQIFTWERLSSNHLRATCTYCFNHVWLASNQSLEGDLQIFTRGWPSSNHLRATCNIVKFICVWLASYYLRTTCKYSPEATFKSSLEGDLQIYTWGRRSSYHLRVTCKYSLEGDIQVIIWGRHENIVLITCDLPVIIWGRSANIHSRATFK